MTALMGTPISATPSAVSAVSRPAARRFRACASKKSSRSTGPGTPLVAEWAAPVRVMAFSSVLDEGSANRREPRQGRARQPEGAGDISRRGEERDLEHPITGEHGN